LSSWTARGACEASIPYTFHRPRAKPAGEKCDAVKKGTILTALKGDGLMIITYYGHSLFALEAADGHTLVTDPFDASVGYPMGHLQGEVVTVSHEHHDHNNTSLVEGSPVVIRGEGIYEPLPNVRVTGIPSFHDGDLGTRRGRNTLYLMEMDGLRLLHLGDLGHELNQADLNRLGRVDILMVPVGGYYTIDYNQAVALCQAMSPRIILPMHYRTAASGRLPIATVEDFLKALDVYPTPMPLLRVTREDLAAQPRVALLTPRPLPVSFGR
jgi:L-ascorbate metabolism protein UlaG (beta-lactamase superfamily)